VSVGERDTIHGKVNTYYDAVALARMLPTLDLSWE
jgi:hypothetical protein